MISTASVLIVDAQDETRSVLKTALERKGLEIFEAKALDDGLALLRRRNPDLIVVDVDFDDVSGDVASPGWALEMQARRKPLLMLGSVRLSADAESGGEIVSKPYHYAPLIRRIEELLGVAPQQAVVAQ